MNKGWRNESMRHSASAKGVNTRPPKYESYDKLIEDFQEIYFLEPGETMTTETFLSLLKQYKVRNKDLIAFETDDEGRILILYRRIQ